MFQPLGRDGCICTLLPALLYSAFDPFSDFGRDGASHETPSKLRPSYEIGANGLSLRANSITKPNVVRDGRLHCHQSQSSEHMTPSICLVIEDDPTMRDLVTNYLEDHGVR